MARVTFDELKHEVTTKAEETGTLPTSVTVHGAQYILQMPVETKMSAMQAVHDPTRLEDVLDRVTFVGTDGSELHA